MVSPRKRTANRSNAKRSTGPRSQEGKLAASRNALRHGLARSVTDLGSLSAEIEQLAVAILESFNGQGDLELAARVAEAQIELKRVRQARHSVLNQASPTPGTSDGSTPNLDKKGHEGPSHKWPSDRNRQGAESQDHPHPMSDRGSALEAEQLSALTKALLALDRYERRALSRRKFAIREFQSSL